MIKEKFNILIYAIGVIALIFVFRDLKNTDKINEQKLNEIENLEREIEGIVLSKHNVRRERDSLLLIYYSERQTTDSLKTSLNHEKKRVSRYKRKLNEIDKTDFHSLPDSGVLDIFSKRKLSTDHDLDSLDK